MNPFTVAVAPFIFLSIACIALFSFLAVASWSGCRMSERETYYKNETIKKIAESPDTGASAALQYLRDQQIDQRRRALEKHRGGLQLGGLVTAAIGIGLMAVLAAHTHAAGVYLMGLIPLLIGVALLVYVQLFAPKA